MVRLAGGEPPILKVPLEEALTAKLKSSTLAGHDPESENTAASSDEESFISARSEESCGDVASDEDSLADFIVNDSADEAELRRGSPRRRQATPPRPRRRRMVIESDSSGSEEEMPLTRPWKEREASLMVCEDEADELIPQVKSLQLSPPRVREVLGDVPNSPGVVPEPAKAGISSISESKQPWIQDHEDIENDHSTTDPVNEDHTESEPSLPPPTPRQHSGARSKAKSAKAEKQRQRAFASTRAEMAQQWLDELDTTITDGRLAQRTARTGGVAIVWSARMRQTAGQAVSRRDSKTGEWSCTITLSSSLITDEDRLYNTVAHEFAHLAVSLQMGKCRPHGPEFFAIGSAIAAAFPARRIVFGRCHRYDVQFKYAWRCTGLGAATSAPNVDNGDDIDKGCGAVFQRHSKSLDVARMRCGRCRGRLVLIRPAPGAENKALSTYQSFVKAKFAETKRHLESKGEGSSGKEVMRELSRLWKIEKEKKKSDNDEGDREREDDNTSEEKWIDASTHVQEGEGGEDEVVEVFDEEEVKTVEIVA